MLPERTVTMLVLRHGQRILMEKRPSTGIWGSLWSLPEISGTASVAEIKTNCQQRFQHKLQNVTFAKSFRHTFSHFHLDILPAIAEVRAPAGKVMAGDQQIWYNLQQPDALGMPAPIKSLLQKLTEEAQLCLV